jgi:hypothetical protein
MARILWIGLLAALATFLHGAGFSLSLAKLHVTEVEIVQEGWLRCGTLGCLSDGGIGRGDGFDRGAHGYVRV